MKKIIKNGKAEGKLILYFKNGSVIYEKNYQNDKNERKEIFYYKDGHLSEGKYKNGKK